jgi:hypothetical protein
MYTSLVDLSSKMMISAFRKSKSMSRQPVPRWRMQVQLRTNTLPLVAPVPSNCGAAAETLDCPNTDNSIRKPGELRPAVDEGQPKLLFVLPLARYLLEVGLPGVPLITLRHDLRQKYLAFHSPRKTLLTEQTLLGARVNDPDRFGGPNRSTHATP